jgi:hypothetical protein
VNHLLTILINVNDLFICRVRTSGRETKIEEDQNFSWILGLASWRRLQRHWRQRLISLQINKLEGARSMRAFFLGAGRCLVANLRSGNCVNVRMRTLQSKAPPQSFIVWERSP